MLDFYTKKQIEELQIKFKDIEFFNLKNINNNEKVDFIIISDVLHHIGFKTLIKFLLF